MRGLWSAKTSQSSPAERLLTTPPSLPREPHQAQVNDFCVPFQQVILPQPHLATKRPPQYGQPGYSEPKLKVPSMRLSSHCSCLASCSRTSKAHLPTHTPLVSETNLIPKSFPP